MNFNGWGKVVIGVLLGALITGFISMAAFTSRMSAYEVRLSSVEANQMSSIDATKDQTKATNELTIEVRLLRQRIDRIDPDGRER